MKWNDLGKEDCSVARSLSVLGDRWTLLILRECFLRVTRFDKFQDRLSISRTMLADRLGKLVDEKLLKKVRYQHNPPRYEYKMTRKGMDLYPMFMAMVNWGNQYYAGDQGVPLLHRHKSCGAHFQPVSKCNVCDEVIHAHDVSVEPGPGFTKDWAGNLNFPVTPDFSEKQAATGTGKGRGTDGPTTNKKP